MEQLTLTETQRRAANEVLSTLDDSVERQLIVLEGLSGVGKSLLLFSLREDIEARGGIVFDDESIYGIGNVINNQQGHVVVPATLNESSYINEKAEKIPDLAVSTVILPGMSLEETTAYVQHMERKNSPLPLEQLVQYSIGVPLLAETVGLMGTEENAARLAANYLRQNLGTGGWRDLDSQTLQDGVKKYLQMDVPQTILESLEVRRKMKDEPYSMLVYYLKRLQDLKRKGVQEPSPLFVAPESMEIYGDMLMRHESYPRVEIFAPELNDEAVHQISKSFGIRIRNNGILPSDPNDSIRLMFGEDQQVLDQEAPRALMFGQNIYRKVHMQLRDREGNAYNMYDGAGSRFFHLDSLISDFMDQYKSGKFPLKPGNTERGMFYFLSVDHPYGEIKVSSDAWMAESLLQQLGVAYIVNNGIINKKYFYNPQQNRIHMLGASSR